MVTLQQQLQQIGAGKTEIERVRGVVTQREREVTEFEKALPVPTGRIEQQIGLASALGVGAVGQELGRQRIVRRTGLERVSRARTSLEDIRGQLSASESRLLEAESRIAGQQRIEADVRKAQNILIGQDTLIGASSRVRRIVENIQQVQAATRARAEREAAGQIILDIEGIDEPLGFSVAPELQEEFISGVERGAFFPTTERAPELGVSTFADLPTLQEFRRETSVVQPADVSLKTFIERKEPVRGTFEFFVERGRGLLGRAEERFAPRGQILAAGVTGERVSIGVQTLPFIIPATAPTALAVTGVSQIATPGGRVEAAEIGLGLEQRFGIPQPVGEIGVFGLAGAGAALGGFGLVRQAEVAAGLPKFDVKFLAREQELLKAGEGQLLSTKGVAEVTRRGLISERKAITAFESLAKVTPGEDIFKFQTATRGIVSEVKGVELVTGDIFIGKPRPFGTLGTGIGRDVEQAITLDVGGIRATRAVEGFEFIGTSKLFPGTRDFEKFITVGKGFQLPSGVVTRSQFGRLETVLRRGGTEEFLRISREGRGAIFGLTKPTPIDLGIDSSRLILKTTRDSTARALSEQSIRESVIQAFPTRPLDVISGARGFRPTGLARGFREQFPAIVQVGGRAVGQFAGLGTFERTGQFAVVPKVVRAAPIGLQLPTLTALQAEGFGLGLGAGQRQLQQLRQQLRGFSGLAQPLVQPTAQRGIQRGLQRGFQLQRQQTLRQFGAPRPPVFAPPFAFAGPLVPLVPFRREVKKKKPKKKKITRRGVSPLGVGFTAVVTGLTGEFPEITVPGLGLTPSQLRVIPRRRTKKKRKKT